MTQRMSAAEAREHLKPAKRSKYRAEPIVIDGIRFDSKAEARRYAHLELLQRAGEITDLERQVRFPLDVNGELICVYIADHAYFVCRENRRVVEDVKGVRTPVYRLKKKLMKALHGVEIVEVKV